LFFPISQSNVESGRILDKIDAANSNLCKKEQQFRFWEEGQTLGRFSNFYVASPVSLKVVFTSTPSSKDHSLGAPEMKKPLSGCPSLYTDGRTALGQSIDGSVVVR